MTATTTAGVTELQDALGAGSDPDPLGPLDPGSVFRGAAARDLAVAP